MHVTQVVPVSAVATQSSFRVLEISELHFLSPGEGRRLPRLWFQSGSLKQASYGLSGGVTRDGFRGGMMQFRSRAQLSNLSMKMRVRPGFTS